jgi:Ran GTPase-activating protein (RanGAP) involved in mRNA processing and transport
MLGKETLEPKAVELQELQKVAPSDGEEDEMGVLAGDEIRDEQALLIRPVQMHHKSFYDDIVYWLQRGSVLRSFLLSLVLKRRDLLTAGENESVLQSNNGPVWLHGQAVPLVNQDAITYSLGVDGLFRGTQDFTEEWWPTAFLGLLLHDVIHYFDHPQGRQGDTILKILAGQSQNPNTLTTALMNNWWYATVLAGIPMLLGSYAAVKRYVWRYSGRLLNNTKQKELLETLQSYRLAFGTDTWKWFVPGTHLKRSLEQVESILLWHRLGHRFVSEQLLEEHSALVKEMISFTRRGRKLTGFYALSTLARLINGLHERDLSRAERQGFSADDVQELREHRQLMLDELTAIGRSSNFIKSLYADYLLWSLGRSRRRVLEPLFWGYSLGLLYIKVRLWMSLIQSIIINTERYLNRDRAKKECEQQKKIWIETPAGVCQCTVCGDWPEVYYPSIFDAQLCLDSVCSRQQTPDRVLESLIRVKPFGIRHVDFSVQDWPHWPVGQWQMILDTAREALTDRTLDFFNLSCQVPNASPLDSKQSEILARFLELVFVRQLDLHNRGIGPNATTVLLPTVSTDSLNGLDLSGNAVGEDGVRTIVRNLPQMTSLRVLKLSGNRFSDYDLEILAPALQNTSVTDLSLCDNQFTEEGLTVLADHLPFNLSSLALSGNDFFGVDISPLGRALSKIPVRVLVLERNGLGDTQIRNLFPFFVNSTVTTVDLSRNDFTSAAIKSFIGVLSKTPLTTLILADNKLGDFGLVYLAQAIPGSSLARLDVSNTQIGDQGLMVFSTALPNTSLQALRMSGNYISEVGIRDFAPILPNTTISELDLSRNDLGDEGVYELSQVLADATSPVHQLDVSENSITSTGAIALSSIFNNQTQIIHLVLRNNPIGDTGARAILEALSGNTTIFIDFNQCGLGSRSVQTLSDKLPSIGLQQIDLGHNAIIGEDALVIAQTLITPIPKENSLGDVLISREQEQAIAQASPNTQLKGFVLSFNSVNESGARALCRVLPSARISITDIDLAGNPIDAHQVDIHSCWISSGKRVEMPFCMAFVYAGIQRLFEGQVSLVQVFKYLYLWFQKYCVYIAQAIQTRQLVDSLVVRMPHSEETLFLGPETDHVVIPHQSGKIVIHGLDKRDALHFPSVPVITQRLSDICQTVSCKEGTCADIQFAEMKVRVTGTGCEQLGKQAIVNEPDSFVNVLAEVFHGTTRGFFGGSVVEYMIAIALAFRQEGCAFVLRRCPEALQVRFLQQVNSSESVLVEDMVELALRSQYGGATTLVHDSVLTIKKACESQQAHCSQHQQPKSATGSQWTKTIQDAASGLLALGAVYGIALAINTLTGNPLIGYLTMPLVANSGQIVRQTRAGYQHGFFGALNAGFNALACSVPGGRIIAKSLAQQEECIAAHCKLSSKAM